jgi:hypothetical protein
MCTPEFQLGMKAWKDYGSLVEQYVKVERVAPYGD